MCPIWPNVVWALDFPFDQTADGRPAQAAQCDRRYSRGVRGPSTSTDPSTSTVSSAASNVSPASRGLPGLDPLRSRAGVHRLRRRRLVPVQRHRHCVHRPPWLAVAERLDRVLRRPTTRRVPQRPTLRLGPGGQDPPRGLALDYNDNRPHTRPTADLAPPSSSKPGSTNSSYNTHSNWTSSWGPLSVGIRRQTVELGCCPATSSARGPAEATQFVVCDRSSRA